MPSNFLYDLILQEFGKRTIASTPVPTGVTDNLNPRLVLRPYQIEAYQLH